MAPVYVQPGTGLVQLWYRSMVVGDDVVGANEGVAVLGLAVLGTGVRAVVGASVAPMGCELSDPAQLRKDNGL